MGKLLWELGFWPTRTNAVYRSGIIDPKEISGPFRILIRHNRLHQKGDKKPVYIGAIALESEEKTSLPDMQDVSRLRNSIRDANAATAEVHSPEESRKLVDEHWRNIIKEVEAVTGVDISIFSWGPSSNPDQNKGEE